MSITTVRLLLSSLMLAWLLSCLLAIAARAQADTALAAGARVRLIWSDDGQRRRAVIGELIAESDSALLVRPARQADTVSVSRSALRSVEVSRGSNTSGALLKGVLIGGGVGLVVGLGLGEDCSQDDFICFDRSETAPLGALLGAGAGALVGAIFGSGERWRQVGQAPRVGVSPVRGRLTIRGSLTI